MPKDPNAAMLNAARRTGRKIASGDGHRIAPRDRGPRPPGSGERVVLGEEGWLLQGRELRVGDVIELYTNAANSWLRGRFEWSGRREDRPRLGINLWDPAGERDADGLPPWVGDLDAEIPKGAICRWP